MMGKGLYVLGLCYGVKSFVGEKGMGEGVEERVGLDPKNILSKVRF
jgi:hypothetical protein